jgi:hypothetical protein
VENDHVLSGLIRKRSEIAGQLEHAQATVRQLIIDIDSLDATIRLFAPDIDLEEIRPKPIPPRHTAFKGEVYRVILTCLRETQMALTTKDLTIRVMADRGLNIADPRLFRTIQKRVGASLRNMRARGRVVSAPGKGSNLTWGLGQQRPKTIWASQPGDDLLARSTPFQSEREFNTP